MTWIWPLLTQARIWPDPPGRFGAVRTHDIHTGVDLYTLPGTVVVAVEPGLVVEVEPFTGVLAGSPWWNETWAVLVEGSSGVVCYGEVLPLVRPGDLLSSGSHVGTVQTVLRKDKGRPMTMLHLELYDSGTRTTVWWHLGQPQPEGLRDPTPYLTGVSLE